jgi:hypothetical protein
MRYATIVIVGILAISAGTSLHMTAEKQLTFGSTMSHEVATLELAKMTNGDMPTVMVNCRVVEMVNELPTEKKMELTINTTMRRMFWQEMATSDDTRGSPSLLSSFAMANFKNVDTLEAIRVDTVNSILPESGLDHRTPVTLAMMGRAAVGEIVVLGFYDSTRHKHIAGQVEKSI